jgi:hypothetical protein
MLKIPSLRYYESVFFVERKKDILISFLGFNQQVSDLPWKNMFVSLSL